MSKLEKILASILLAACVLVFPRFLFAADILFGRDTDQNDSVDEVAPGGCDEDFDLRDSVACGGFDCDDTKNEIYPGIWVTAGSGNVKLCQANGTYTSPVGLSSIACTSGSGQRYFVSATGSTSAGCGSIGTPCDWRCFFFANGLACNTSLAAGDCVIQRGGTYTSTYTESSTPHHMYFLAKSGTLANPITWIAAPGETVIYQGAGVKPGTQIVPVEFSSSSHWVWGGSDKKIEIIGGWAGHGLFNDGGVNVRFQNFITRDTDGAAGGNVSGWKVNGSSADDWTVDGFLSYGNYMRDDVPNENNTEFVIFRGTGWTVKNGTAWSTPVSGSGRVGKLKHADTPSSWTMDGLVMQGSYGECLELMGGGGLIKNSYFLDCAKNSGYGVAWTGGSGSTRFEDATTFEHNLISGSASVLIYTNESTENTAPGDFGILTIQDNIFMDNRPTAYPSSASDGFLALCPNANANCSNTFRTAMLGGKVVIRRNCHWNSTPLSPLYNVFGDNVTGGSAGDIYSNFTTWAASGLETNSFNEDPLAVSPQFVPEAPNCDTFGPQFTQEEGGGEPPPEPGSGAGGDSINLLSEYIGSWS